jgi:glucose-1-phosphate cytidylyltransferase
MKVIILAGGLGTRISEETSDKPKPMVSIGGEPMLWHVMSIFAEHGLKDFFIATGYKGDVISEWVKGLKKSWTIAAIDTGLETQTGGRIKKCMEMVPGERVLATYGDGVGNIDIKRLLDFHGKHGKKATLTAVRPPARFGYLDTRDGQVIHFGEKSQSDAGWINGGFFVFEPQVGELILDATEPLETGVLPRLAKMGELMAFDHYGFWKPMDTLREKEELDLLSKINPKPWLDFEGCTID